MLVMSVDAAKILAVEAGTSIEHLGNTKGGSIIVLLTSSLTGLD